MLNCDIYCKKEQAVCIICVLRLIHGIFYAYWQWDRRCSWKKHEENSIKIMFFCFVLCCGCLTVACINVYCKCFAVLRSKEEHMKKRTSTHAHTWKVLLLKPIESICSLYIHLQHDISVELCKLSYCWLWSTQFLFRQKQQQKHWLWCDTGQRWSLYANCMLSPMLMYSDTI